MMLVYLKWVENNLLGSKLASDKNSIHVFLGKNLLVSHIGLLAVMGHNDINSCFTQCI